MSLTHSHSFYVNRQHGQYLYLYIICLHGWPQSVFLLSSYYSFQENIHQMGRTLMCTWVSHRPTEKVGWAHDHNIQLELRLELKFRGFLIWTINGWPWYDLLSRMTHANYVGYLSCGPEVTLRDSRELHKCLYIGSRHWLRSKQGHSVAFGNEI